MLMTPLGHYTLPLTRTLVKYIILPICIVTICTYTALASGHRVPCAGGVPDWYCLGDYPMPTDITNPTWIKR